MAEVEIPGLVEVPNEFPCVVEIPGGSVVLNGGFVVVPGGFVVVSGGFVVLPGSVEFTGTVVSPRPVEFPKGSVEFPTSVEFPGSDAFPANPSG